MSARPSVLGVGLSPRSTLDDPQETLAFRRLVMRAVECTRPRRVLDVGCGTGIPTIAAARAGAKSVVGIDIAEQNVERASENIRLAHYESRVSAFHASWDDVATGRFPLGPVDLLVSNPPYVPSGEGSAVDGGPTGTRLLDAIVEGTKEGTRGLALLFGSLSDPLEVVARIERRGFQIVHLCAMPVVFGRYTSEPKVLTAIKRRRALGTAFFWESARVSPGSLAPREYLTLGVIAERKGPHVAPLTDVYRGLQSLLLSYQRTGRRALLQSSLLARL